MSTDDERAVILRAIANGGFSPFEDQDGSTTNTLLEMAEELAPMAAVPPKRRRSPLRRWYHKLALRAKLRWFGLVPACAIAWAAVEARSLAAQATGDSLITTLLVRQVIGEWRDSTYRGYCLTWVAAREDRPHVLFLLDAVAADTTQTPPCVAADGTRYPVLLDAPACPPEERIRVTDREWILIRCGPASFARYRRQPEKRT